MRASPITVHNQKIYKSSKFYKAIEPLLNCKPPFVVRELNKDYNHPEYHLTLSGETLIDYIMRLRECKH